jgi:hypothetical protein
MSADADNTSGFSMQSVWGVYGDSQNSFYFMLACTHRPGSARTRSQQLSSQSQPHVAARWRLEWRTGETKDEIREVSALCLRMPLCECEEWKNATDYEIMSFCTACSY